MMEFVKRYKTQILITGIIIILVLFRSFSISHFKSDATLRAKPSVNHLTILTEKQVDTLAGEILLLNLGKIEGAEKNLPGTSLNIPVDSVLNKVYLRKVLKHRGPVLINSSSNAIAARIWMVLSQMGCNDLFILSDDPDNETLKYKFRSDTLNRTESEAKE